MKADAQAITRRPVISALGVICAAQFVLQLDFSIVNVALPTIQRDLGFAPADLQWVVTGYALTFGSLLLLGGRSGDLLGRRRLLVLGLLLFGLASLTCGLVMLILSRLVQGAGGALVSPSALSLLTTSNPEGAARNRAHHWRALCSEICSGMSPVVQ
jgi:MFS family permease